jgi:MFS family permease
MTEHLNMTPVNNAVNSLLSNFMANPNWKFEAEHVTVVNAGVIIAFQLLVTFLVKKAKPLPTMILGIGFGTIGMAMLAISASPWIFVAGIMVFTVGEMVAHPKFISYIGLIAPPDKKAVYMGYSFLYGFIGSGVGAFVGAALYVQFIEKTFNPTLLWLLFSGIGVISIIGLLIYNRIFGKK